LLLLVNNDGGRMRALGRLTGRSIVALLALAIGGGWASWLYLTQPVIELRTGGPSVNCFALSRDPLSAIYPVLAADRSDAAADYMAHSVSTTYDTLEQRDADRRQVGLQMVAGCQDARLNRQTNLFLVVACAVVVMVLAGPISLKPGRPKAGSVVEGERR
jgi:hypothetical protein